MKKLIFFFFILFSTCLLAQVGINTTTPNAQLDIKSSNQATPSNTDGVLIPKVDAFPATNPTAAQQGMLVYLTTNVGSSQPGFYYWDNPTTAWLPVKGTDGGTLDQAYDFGGAGNGRTITADAGAVTINGTDGFVSTGTSGSGAIAPSGAGTRMVWNPRKAAFRVGTVSGTTWNDTSIGEGSSAFGNSTLASGKYSFAFGDLAEATGYSSTSFGFQNIASGNYATAFGGGNLASGELSVAFGNGATASGMRSTAFGQSNTASGFASTAFGQGNQASSYAEVVLGIGASNYTTSTNGSTQFRVGNSTDRLFVIGNAVDTNNDNLVQDSERRDAMVVLKNGLTRLPSTTNTMINDADGKAVVTKEYLQSNTSGTLDQAYDFGGAGLGSTITADAGAVTINGTDGLVSTGTSGSGAIAPSGAGTRMVWNPRKAAFRVGQTNGTGWDDANIGTFSTAFGFNTTASGTFSTAFGGNTIASGATSTAFGSTTTASGFRSTAFGFENTSSSHAETVIGIGATTYTPSANGATQFRTANAGDRLFVIGNAIDSNNNGLVDTAERSDAMIVLKNGLTRLPSTTNTMIDAADGKAIVTKEYLQSNTSGTLDQAYDFGGDGLGSTITADAGAVTINGTDGLVSTGTSGSGAIAPSGAGTRMVWNPRKAAFRAGIITGAQWDDTNIGQYSVALGLNSVASGNFSIAFGQSTASESFSIAGGSQTVSSGISSTSFGNLTIASGMGSTALGSQSESNGNTSFSVGNNSVANGSSSIAMGNRNIAVGSSSVAIGNRNTARSFGETVVGIGATTYTPSTNGDTQFRAANATDRIFVIGNAIDANNSDNVDDAERRDAMVVLKNGNTGIGTSTPSRRLHVSNGPSGGTSNSNTGLLLESSGAVYQHFLSPSNFEKGLLFGSETASISGAIIHNNTNALEGFQFRTGGNATRMTLTNLGELGVGTNTPDRKLEVSNAGTVFARITNTTTTDVGIEFKRSGSDWRVHNTTGLLLFGQSNDDLATVTEVLRLGGGSVTPAADNTITLGNSTLKWTAVFATNGTIQTSDANDKKEMKSLTFGLDKIKQLRPISFKWKDGAIDNSATHLGFVAQEVQEILPEVIVDSDWVELPEGLGKVWQKSEKLGMKYSEIIPVLVKGIQEQQSVIEKQQQEIDGLKQQLQEQYQILLDRIKKVEEK